MSRLQHASFKSDSKLSAADSVLWTPSAYTAFKCLLTARLCAAIWSPISDCDETYNYWEPMHYLLYGYGFQTWEYSPVYAIRSYAYLWIHSLPLLVYKRFLQANKILVFYFLRCLLAFVCAICEVYFYKGVCRCFGANTGRLMLALLTFSTGLFISSTAYLPSSFAMYLTMLAMGAWFLHHHQASILAVAASGILGWPFVAVLGTPIAYDILIRRRKIQFFIKWCCFSLILFLLPSVYIDSYYYGKLVVAPFNIIKYNVLSKHGPNIYGIEPWSFYFVNLFLNFNIVFLVAFVSLPFSMMMKKLKPQHSGPPHFLVLSGLYIWTAIFFTRPHKEERFMFPVYPLICLSAAITLDNLQALYSKIMKRADTKVHYSSHSSWIIIACLFLFSSLSVSRTFCLIKGYRAPLDVYAELSNISENREIHRLATSKHVNVCVGKEWYRFTSSFFLPNERWHLRYIRSEFKGLLPQPYKSGSDGTRVLPPYMNDMNQDEPMHYVDIQHCHYLIDLDLNQESPLEPRYSQKTDQWKVITEYKYLDNARSHRFLRAFYIPFISEKHCMYVNYNILQTTRTKSKNLK